MRRAAGSVGGVQSHGNRLSRGLSRHFDVQHLHWPGPLWLSPFLMGRLGRKAAKHPAKLIHCDDGLTSLMGAKLAARHGKKVVATVHGMDLTLPFGPYQAKLRRALPLLHRVVCVSRATATEAVARGADPGCVVIIPNAAEDVADPLETGPHLAARIKGLTGLDLAGKRLLFSLGRPVKRKGFDFFAREVLPRLGDDVVYIAAGPTAKTPGVIKAAAKLAGPHHGRLLLVSLGLDTSHDELVALNRSQPNFLYLTDISDELRNLLLHAADLFLMPNQRVAGDMEGFGIVALEASVRRTPVVASGIEGITDAVADGINGKLVAPDDPAGWAAAINDLLTDQGRLDALGQSAAAHAKDNFAISIIVDKYRALFEELAAD